jgi:hypothetical protein
LLVEHAVSDVGPPLTSRLIPSLRAKRSNPATAAGFWIASSLALLAMTGRLIFSENRNPLFGIML